MVNTAKEQALLVSHMVFFMGLTTFIQHLLKVHLLSIKLMAILIIFCYSTHFFVYKRAYKSYLFEFLIR